MWQVGEAMAYPFAGCWSSPLGFWVLQHWPFPFKFFDTSTTILKIIQCAMPIGFWIPAIRKYALWAAGIFLVLVSTFLTIWWFLVLIPCFLAFLPPEQIAKSCQLKTGPTNRNIRLND